MNTPDAPRPDSVRLALPAEAAQIAGIQRDAWRELGGGVAEALLTSKVDEVAAVWEQAIMRPPDPRCRVLVAVASGPRDRVVGFATTQPADDEDADPSTDALIGEFAISPLARGEGHGSRLMHAVVDTLRADRFTRALYWVVSADDARRTFFTESGFGYDGAHRAIGPDDESVQLKQLRLHTLI
ncbi:MAG: GNAT family N-acetyltransferase [Propionibacterium sp.]|nr:GNAT family N-acetyltransferase [Propionibacterium sp.]